MKTNERNDGRPGGALRALLIAAAVLTWPGPSAAADAPPSDASPTVTPPRLRFLDGAVSFWRPGADDWAVARVNTPLAAGDELYAADGASAEVEVCGQTYMRSGAESDLGLESVDADFLQAKVTSGRLVLDLVRFQPGHRMEIDTPNAAFVVEQGGYYRVDVDGETTVLTVRRGGKARIFPPVGDPVDVGVDQRAAVVGTDAPRVEMGGVPSLDAWDRWNFARRQPARKSAPSVDGSSGTENPPAAAASEPAELAADASPSRDYVSADIAGTEDLDAAGEWRDTPDYGHVWVPRDVPPGWAPYTRGNWIFDPTYGWSWVDDAPWGWAPFHYGRWAMVDETWAWEPGPVVAPVYTPALVAFLANEDGGTAAGPDVGWVALGYGEPVIPWWGGIGTIGTAYWDGWGGPRIVNEEIVSQTTVVNVRTITRYRNVNVANAVVATDRDHFGRAGAQLVHVARERVERLHPLADHLEIRPTPASLVAGAGAARRPPDRIGARAVVATRAPEDPASHLHAAGLDVPARSSAPAMRKVAAPGEVTPHPSLTQHASAGEPRLHVPPPRPGSPGPSARTRGPVAPNPPTERVTAVRRYPAPSERASAAVPAQPRAFVRPRSREERGTQPSPFDRSAVIPWGNRGQPDGALLRQRPDQAFRPPPDREDHRRQPLQEQGMPQRRPQQMDVRRQQAQAQQEQEQEQACRQACLQHCAASRNPGCANGCR